MFAVWSMPLCVGTVVCSQKNYFRKNYLCQKFTVGLHPWGVAAPLGEPRLHSEGSRLARISGVIGRWREGGTVLTATSGPPVRCGAVRCGAVERSRRSSRRALARRPKHHSNSEQSSAHCAVNSLVTLAAGSRAATRSSAPPTSDQRQGGGSSTREFASRLDDDALVEAHRVPRRRSSTSASSSSREANSLVEEPPPWRWSLVGGADERVAARDPAASECCVTPA